MLGHQIRTSGIAALLCVAAPLAQAQTSPSLLDLIKPEFVLQRVLQSGVMALRTQVNLIYDTMDVDIGLSKVSITGVRARPDLQWPSAAGCEVFVQELALRMAPLDRPDLLRVNVQAHGIDAAPGCLPPDQRLGLQMAGLERVAVPYFNLDLTYDIAQASAQVQAHARVDGFVAVDVNADLPYLWFDGSADMDNPEPVVFLRSASVKLENLGAFEALSPMLPPPFTDPQQSPLVLEGLIGGQLVEMNRGTKLSPAQTAFVSSITSTWTQFLANPTALVLETNIEEQDQVHLEFDVYARNPSEVFSNLRPTLSMSLAATRNAVPANIMRRVIDGETGDLSAEALAQIGIALITGVGVPKDVERGVEVLDALATGGDGEAALALASALAQSDPGRAYGWALIAGAHGQTSAITVLNRLEAAMPMADVLRAQAMMGADTAIASDDLANLATIRATAMALVSGSGRARSYEDARVWALIGAAAGDQTSINIVTELSDRMAAAEPAGQTAWALIEQETSARAMALWLDLDLPSKLVAP